MIYFGRLIKENLENNIFLNYYEMMSKALNFEFFNQDFENVRGNSLLLEVNHEVLRSCKIFV